MLGPLLLLALAAAALAALAAEAEGASVGYKVSVCDPLSPAFGCPFGSWANGDRLQCTVNGRIMPWAQEPEPPGSGDSHYVVTAGPSDDNSPGASNAVTSYVPGELLTIRVRTTDLGWRFRGLLATAETQASQTSTREKAGQWEVVPEEPAVLDHPVLAGCENTLVHASAQVKRALVTAKWRAPAAGTGAVVFHVLVKVGEANHGWFHRPATTLVLQEGAPRAAVAPGAVEWTRGDTLGQSCDGVCAAKAPQAGVASWTCNQASFSTATESDLTPVFDRALCARPYLSGCGPLGPTSSDTGLCSYHDAAVCSAEGRSTAAPTCDAANADARQGLRWCPCLANAAPPPTTTTTTSTSTSATTTPTSGGTPACTPLTTCPNPATMCGNLPNNCSTGLVGCGGCPSPHDACVDNRCGCTPHTCMEHGWQCGVHADGCGGLLDCGSCAAGDYCHNNVSCIANGCTPIRSCPQIAAGGGSGMGCGLLTTACRENNIPVQIQCGVCRSPATCDIVNNVCECIPIDAQTACSGTCNSASDGCGGTVACPPCDCPGLGQINRGGACICDADSGWELDQYGRCSCADGGEFDGTQCSNSANAAAPGPRAAAAGAAFTAAAAAAAAAAVLAAMAGGGGGKPSTPSNGNGNNKLMLQVVVLAVVLAALATARGASAHNWINSPSRSADASTIKPHKVGTGMPHVQVGLDQRFQIEWMTAHTSSDLSYFITIRAEHEYILNRITQAQLHDYLDSCPASACPGGANAHARQGHWQRYHRKGRRGDNTDNDPSPTQITIPNFFEEVVFPGNNDYVARPSRFGGWVRDEGVIDEPTGISITTPAPPNEIYQLRYKAADLNNDKRAEYSNPSYPELIAVAAFFHTAGQFIRPDFAQFTIPSSHATPGRYMVNWWWQGYYDTIDVDVVANNVPEANIYGVDQAPGAAVWFERPHAAFVDPKWVFGPCRLVPANGDISQCMNDCQTNCDGITVAPVRYPAAANSMYSTPSDTPRVPWGTVNPGQGYDSCEQAPLLSSPAGSYVCYAVDGRDNNIANTAPPVVETDDPDDPLFYSVTYLKHTGAIFDLSQSVAASAASKWRFGAKCVDCCTARDFATPTSFYTFPRTAGTETCRNCDLEPCTN